MASYNKNSSNRLVVPEAQEAMNKFKMEAANAKLALTSKKVTTVI